MAYSRCMSRHFRTARSRFFAQRNPRQSSSPQASSLAAASPQRSPPHRGSRSFALRVGACILRWHQSGVVTKGLELATEMMRSNTDSMPIRHGGMFATRLQTWPRDHHFCRIAPDDPALRRETSSCRCRCRCGNCAVEVLAHGMLLLFGVPC
jgi:hypothetical protein